MLQRMLSFHELGGSVNGQRIGVVKKVAYRLDPLCSVVFVLQMGGLSSSEARFRA